MGMACKKKKSGDGKAIRLVCPLGAPEDYLLTNEFGRNCMDSIAEMGKSSSIERG